MQADDIDQYFQRYGWTASKTADGHWKTTFTGDLGIFTIDVRLDPEWLLFAIDLSARGGPDSPERMRDLLIANGEMLMAKFAIGPQGNLLLRVEMPTEGFGYSHFADCLGALSHYADRFCREWQQA